MLQILGEPALVDAAVDVIPGQGLPAKRLKIITIQRRHCTPATKLHLPVTPLKPGLGNGTSPGVVSAIQGLEPGIHARAGTPGRFNHRRQTPVSATHKIFHRRQAHIREVEAHTSKASTCITQQLLTTEKLACGNAVPLKGCVWLRCEVADGGVEAEAAQITATLLKHPTGFGDAEHIGIGLSRKPDHEIELDLAVSVLHRRTDALQQVIVGQPLVDDVAQTLRAGFRSEGESCLACTSENVGDVLVETVHPLARELKSDIAIRKPIAKLHSHCRESEVITAAERQQ